MASIHKDIIIDANPADVWDALRDFGALHTRLVPGFVTDTKLDGDARIVTFSNGTVAREVLVDCDDKRQRLVYAIKSERPPDPPRRSKWPSLHYGELSWARGLFAGICGLHRRAVCRGYVCRG